MTESAESAQYAIWLLQFPKLVSLIHGAPIPPGSAKCEEGLHHDTGTGTVEVDAADADSAEAARPGKPVEESCIDQGRVHAVEHLEETGHFHLLLTQPCEKRGGVYG